MVRAMVLRPCNRPSFAWQLAELHWLYEANGGQPVTRKQWSRVVRSSENAADRSWERFKARLREYGIPHRSVRLEFLSVNGAEIGIEPLYHRLQIDALLEELIAQGRNANEN